jgi:hypothetical protein
MSSYAIKESTVPPTFRVTLDDLKAMAQMRSEGVPIENGKLPSREARALCAATYRVMQAFSDGAPANEGSLDPFGRILGSSHDQEEQATAVSAGPSLDATLSPDVDAVGTKVGACDGRDEVSTVFAKRKLAGLITRSESTPSGNRGNISVETSP